MALRLPMGVLAAVFFAALVLCSPGDAGAQSLLDGGTIEEIRIEGSQRVDPSTVQNYMRLDPGDPFDALRLDESLKALFATGLFADVTLTRQGDALIVRVVENPIINRIAFEGNSSIDNDILEVEIQLRPRVVYTRTRVQQDVERLLNLYRSQGRFAATVEPKIIRLEQNRVDLVFEIDEGATTGIETVNFIGNRVFSDSSLRGEIATTESAWWRFLTSNDTYDPDRLNFDQELLRRFYLSEGYADFRVLSVVAELTPDKENFIITFTVDEGPRYRFGDIEVTSTIPNLDAEVLRDFVTTEQGDWYDATEVDDTIDVLTNQVGNLGYAFVDVRPATQRNTEDLVIDLNFEVQEGPRVFVERIDIEGNQRTLDKVIRREFRLVEGDAFNSAKLRRSRQRLNNLGFFRTVAIDNVEGSAPDRTVIQVNVEEQSTGDLSFGAGFSSASGPLGNITLRERNLLGRGQDLRVSFSLSGASSEIDLSFTEPYFLDRPIAAGFDVFRTTRDINALDFEIERIGASVRAGYDLTEHTRQVVRYTFERQELDDINSDSSLAAQEEDELQFRSIVSQTLTWDRRDNRFDPTSGWRISLENELAGLGGDTRFLKSTTAATYFIPVLERVTLSIGGEAGFLTGLGEDTNVSDRFLLGGSNFRGFEVGGIGPRDLPSDDAIGGTKFYKGTVELAFPLGLPEEFSVRGRWFVDAGSLWDADNAPGNIVDDHALRVSTGPGVSWDSPFGPLRVDLGFPILKEEDDKTELISFSFGTQF